MEPSSRHSWTRSLDRLLAPLVLVAIIVGQTGSASAVSVSSASGFDPHEHSLFCGCGVKCKQAACCCSPEDEKPRSGSPTSTDAGPCMNSAPCGVPTPANAPASGVGAKVAALAPCERGTLVNVGRLLPDFTLCIFPPRRSSRLDDPPERPDVA